MKNFVLSPTYLLGLVFLVIGILITVIFNFDWVQSDAVLKFTLFEVAIMSLFGSGLLLRYKLS